MREKQFRKGMKVWFLIKSPDDNLFYLHKGTLAGPVPDSRLKVWFVNCKDEGGNKDQVRVHYGHIYTSYLTAEGVIREACLLRIEKAVNHMRRYLGDIDHEPRSKRRGSR